MVLPELTLVDTTWKKRTKRRGRGKGRGTMLLSSKTRKRGDERHGGLSVKYASLSKTARSMSILEKHCRSLNGTGAFFSRKSGAAIYALGHVRVSLLTSPGFSPPAGHVGLSSSPMDTPFKICLRDWTHNPALMLYLYPLDISICYHLLCAYTRYPIRNDVLSPLPCPHTKTSGSR